MISPKNCECGKQGSVIDSRQHLKHLRRRYSCECGERWTTTEVRIGSGSGGDKRNAETVLAAHYSSIERESVTKKMMEIVMALNPLSAEAKCSK